MVRTQEMYFLKKIHKNPPTARPIVSGCGGPTERISAYLDHWLQPLAKSLPSFIKETKEFIKYIESTKLPKDCILCTLDVSSLHVHKHPNGRRYLRCTSGHRKLGKQGPPVSSNQLEAFRTHSLQKRF